MEAETLEHRRNRLQTRLEMIQTEQKFHVFNGEEKEPVKLKRAIARIDRKINQGEN